MACTAAIGSTAGCLGGLGTGGADCGEDCDIGMSTNAFIPEEFETTVGSTVVWRNTSSRAHTVTAYDGGIPEAAAYFASGGYDSETAARDAWDAELGGGLDPDESYEHTFEVPGEYAYACIPHERQGMTGIVRVTE